MICICLVIARAIAIDCLRYCMVDDYDDDDDDDDCSTYHSAIS